MKQPNQLNHPQAIMRVDGAAACDEDNQELERQILSHTFGILPLLPEQPHQLNHHQHQEHYDENETPHCPSVCHLLRQVFTRNTFSHHRSDTVVPTSSDTFGDECGDQADSFRFEPRTRLERRQKSSETPRAQYNASAALTVKTATAASQSDVEWFLAVDGPAKKRTTWSPNSSSASTSSSTASLCASQPTVSTSFDALVAPLAQSRFTEQQADSFDENEEEDDEEKDQLAEDIGAEDALFVAMSQQEHDYDDDGHDNNTNHLDEEGETAYLERRLQEERQRHWARERLAAAVFSYPRSLRHFCVEAQRMHRQWQRKQQRILAQAVDLLTHYLKQIAAARPSLLRPDSDGGAGSSLQQQQVQLKQLQHSAKQYHGNCPLPPIKENVPQGHNFVLEGEEEDDDQVHCLDSDTITHDAEHDTADSSCLNHRIDSLDSVSGGRHITVLDSQVTAELHQYVSVLARLYLHDNHHPYQHQQHSYHNFEHAVHVAWSVHYLLRQYELGGCVRLHRPVNMAVSGSRIKPPKQLCKKGLHATSHNLRHPNTHHSVSTTPSGGARQNVFDPLIQFALILAALIHDVDHAGVSLPKPETTPFDKDQSNSAPTKPTFVNRAWDVLVSDAFGFLQRRISHSDAEWNRVEQVISTAVMTTNQFDREMGKFRHNRSVAKDMPKLSIEQKPESDPQKRCTTTTVMKQIMQASDVVHTMQPWTIYLRWNQRLFDEHYTAYKAGRIEHDPSSFWYESEIKFLDECTVPLAKQLCESAAFGAAIEECLSNALSNRTEWEANGKSIVRLFADKYELREI